MTIPRLLDDPEDDFERAVLRSASLDGPSDGTVARGITALVAAATTGAVVSSAAAATAAAATADGIAGSAATAKALLVPGLVKWLGVGVVAGAVTAGVVQVQLTPERAPSRALPASARPATAPPSPRGEGQGPAVPSLVAPSAPEGSVDEAATATAKSAPVKPAELLAPREARLAPARSPAPTVSVGRLGDVAAAPSIGAELAALEQARGALRERRPADVLQALAAYDSLRGPHVLMAEATMLRIEALLQSGDRAGAARRAAAELQARPGGPHAARLREILAEQKP